MTASRLVAGMRLAQREKRVTEQRAKGGDGLGHDGQMGLVAERSGEHGLAQAEPIGAQFAFDLEAMLAQRDIQIGEEIVAEENAMALLHVEQFDGEDVGGAMQFVESENSGG